MGTRGSYGFRAAGEDRLAYNQFDSYPAGLGAAIADDIQRHLLKSPPTVEQVLAIELLPLGDERADIHAAFKQGPLSTLLTRQRPRFASGNRFVGYSLFCEWAYVFNLDTGKLEVYRGFQRTPGVGRYAHLNPNPDHEPTYYGMSLVAELPLAEATPEAMLRLDQVVSREEMDIDEWRVEVAMLLRDDHPERADEFVSLSDEEAWAWRGHFPNPRTAGERFRELRGVPPSTPPKGAGRRVFRRASDIDDALTQRPFAWGRGGRG